MLRTSCVAASLLGAALACDAHAGVTILSQQRTLSVETTFDANLQSVTELQAGPFVRALDIGGVIPGVNGATPVVAAGRIDCQLDPNKITANGLLAGAGGIAALTMVPEAGNGKVLVEVTFRVDVATAYGIVAAPRPAMRPTDEFRVDLRDLTRNQDVYYLDEGAPAQTVNMTGTLQPGEYRMRYKVEGTFGDAETSRTFGFGIAFPRPAATDCNNNGVDDYVEIVLGTAPDANHNGVIDSCECLGDWNGGGLAIQDIFDFVNDWFAGSADFDHSGQTTIEDIFAFLNGWLAGC